MTIGQGRRLGDNAIWSSDWLLLLDRSNHVFSLANVAKRVPHPRSNGLEIGHKLHVKIRLVVHIRTEVEHVLKSLLHQIFEEQSLGNAGKFEDLVDKLASLVQSVDVLLDLLRERADGHLFSVKDLVQFLKTLLFTLLDHCTVKVVRVVNIILCLVVLDLESTGHVLDSLGRSPQLVYFPLGILIKITELVHLSFADVHDELAVVSAAVIKHGTLLTDRLRAGLAVEFEDVGLVAGTVDGFLRFVSAVLFVALQFTEASHTMTLKTMHKLVRHHAVGAQEICTVKTAGHCIGVLALAACAV